MINFLRISTPLMIAIQDQSIDCVNMLCKYDNIDILDCKSRYPKFNSLEFGCHYNNIENYKHY